MANQQDLNLTYTTIDKIFRWSLGEMADFSGAKYDGNFSMTLEEAQDAKHKFMADSLNIHEGSRVIDLGCGWGPFLKYIRDVRKAEGIGITLSEGQAKACQKNGLNVHVRDCRCIRPGDFGTFDAVTSVGAFEHFCSVEEWNAGKQETIYRNFFKSVHDLLKENGKAYIQTMVFGKNMIPYEDFDITAPKGTAPRMLALMTKEFPGSWLPYGSEMVLNAASPYFNLVSISSGRKDYIETINQWRKRFRQFSLKKYLVYASQVPRYIFDKEFRQRAESLITTPNQTCFEKEIMEHYRMVFEKKPAQEILSNPV
jgi:cyclopropane-fatty-acyl-phospholipid synthase